MPTSRALPPLMALTLFPLASCVDEKIVYRDRELFEEVPSAAADFIGYSDRETKLTVCGNCHVERQGQWVKTAHAKAWAGLQDSGSAAESCEACHTTNELGNAATALAGYTATKEKRYEDVQCEACHGAGLTHVTNPVSSNVPLAPMAVAVGATTGCGECHQGTHNPFVEQWASSQHGAGAVAPAYRTRAGCMECHGGEAALEAWGIHTEYVEKGQNVLGVACAVCHDPHGSPNTKQLRFPIDVRNVDQNLCMKCHHKRAIPDLSAESRGAHSPQGPLLIGEDVGWIPPGFPYEQGSIVGTHGTEANPRLCAACHVSRFEVTDPATGGHVFTSTGHSFKAIPCLDAQGVPTADDSCPKTAAARSFKACTASGCHGSAAVAASAMSVAQTRIKNLVTEVNALLAKVPAGEFANDGKLTSAEGAKFNASLGAIPSSAVHNPFLMEALLIASVSELKRAYGLTQASNVSLTPMFVFPVK